MKKIFVLICGILIILSFSSVIAADFTIVKSPQTVSVNGKIENFEVYNIDGNNFFKLRDIAYVLNGTGSQFSVEYNDSSKLIEAVKGEAYVSNGNEMKTGVDHSTSAVKSSQKLNINYEEKELLAYNIAGNNFFKLRDLGTELDFTVDYNPTTNTVVVESKKDTPIANIINIEKKAKDGMIYIEITADNPINSYHHFSMFDEESKRIIIDISDSIIAMNNNQIDINENEIIKIRIGNQGGTLNRLVFDLENSKAYQVLQSENKKTIYLVFAENLTLQELLGNTDANIVTEPNNEIIASGDNKEEIIDVVESGENIIIDDPISQEEPIPQEPIDNEPEKPTYTEEELENRVKITSVKYSSTNNKVTVSSSQTFQFEEEKLEDENQLIFDIKNAELNVQGPTEIKPNNKIITEITFYQYDEMTVRVEIKTKSKTDYSAKMKSNNLEITVDEPSYQNLVYTSTKDSGIVTLNDVKKDVFSVTEDSNSYQYTIKYSESRFTCGKETLTIDDEWLETIKISTGKIILQGKSKVSFTMEQSGNDVIVKITPKTTTTNTTNTNSNENTSTTTTITGHTNTVTRTSKFTVNQVSETRIQVGKIYINNTSGITLDLNELSKKSNLAINSNASVLIYHTHTSEGFLESGIDSNFHTTDNTKNVVAVGNNLEKYLLLKNINVLHDITRHDTSYNDSYDESLVTVQNILKKKKYDLIIDLHRDAISSNLYYRPTATINGQTCAKLMLVMGSNASGLYNPNWMENLKTAILIQNKAEEMYPGLFRDLSLVKYRYNQHLSPGSILIEVGATGNTMEDTQNSMKYLANVLAALDK